VTAPVRDRLRDWWQARPDVHRATELSRTWGASWTTVQRLRDDLPLRRDEALSWLVTAVLTVVAFVLRFPRLGDPPYIQFDETYYAKEAWSLLHFGYARQWPDGDTVNPILNSGGDPASHILGTPDFVVHPMLAKWFIAAGEWLFGFNPFGWRFAAVLFGCLLVAAVVRLARRLSRSTLIGALAGFLVCVDGLSVVMSRIALLDIFQAALTVAAVAAVVKDRDWFRERLARHLEARGLANLAGRYGPALWWRPWRLTAGLAFGLACGCKWNSMYVLAVMGVVSVVLDWQARRTAGAGSASLRSLVLDGVPAFFSLVIVGFLTYVATWASWFATSGGYGRHWGADNPGATSTKVVGATLASWWHYQADIWRFHTGDYMAHVTHGWDGKPWGWLVIARPILFAMDSGTPSGTDGCTAGARSAGVRSLVLDGVPAFGYLVVVGFLTYLGTWASWFATSGGYYRHWGTENPGATSTKLFGNALASWWHYQVDIWQYHTGSFMASATHQYDAKPWGWLVIARPISMAFSGNIEPGVDGCKASPGEVCYQVVLGIGTPFLWWMAALALIAGLFFWIFGHDWRFAIPILGMAATWIGWFPNDDRPVFYFYAIMIIPFTATILAMCLGKILGPPSGGQRRRRGAIILSAAVVLILADFIFLYPILTWQMITNAAWNLRIWFGSWS